MRRLVRCLTLAAFALPAAGHAQIRASELGSVSQVVDGTKLTVTYSRPRARGRETIFGTAAAHWGEVWTPGANYATTIESSRNVKLNGVAVPKGRYSVWFIVRQRGDWTMLLDPKDRVYHMNPPDSAKVMPGQIRIPLHTDSTAFTDVLTWWFPEVRADGGTLAFAWERRRANVSFEVEPSFPTTLAIAEAQPYVGRYEYADKDSTGKPTTAALVVMYDDTSRTMKAEWVPWDNYMKRFAMIRVAPDMFVPGIYDKAGRIYEVIRPEMLFQFKRDGGKVTVVDLRDDQDSLQMHAIRKP